MGDVLSADWGRAGVGSRDGTQEHSLDWARSDPAFSQLYHDTYAHLVAQIAAILGTLEEAEDVVQEAFARAATRWLTISQYDIPGAWVRRVSINLAISKRRKAKRLMIAVTHLSVLAGDVSRPGPDETREDSLSVMAALRELPLKYRTAIVLHHLADLEVSEVAEILQVSPNTVKTRLVRGRARLRAIYSRFSDDPHGSAS
jgi:RNA polymerase sigma-70 factor, ECF subfamily